MTKTSQTAELQRSDLYPHLQIVIEIDADKGEVNGQAGKQYTRPKLQPPKTCEDDKNIQTNYYAEQCNLVSLNATTVMNCIFAPFHPGLLSIPFPVVVSTWQFEEPEELPIRFSTCSNTLPSSISEPESQTKSYLYQSLKFKNTEN